MDIIGYRFRKFFFNIRNILFPIECVDCGKEGDILCSKCLPKVPTRLFKTTLSSGLLFGVVYGYSVKTVAQSISFGKYFYSKDPFVCLTENVLSDISLFLSPYPNVVLVPVPLFDARKNERGFNQSEVIASVISDNLGYEVVDLMQRVRNTPQQARLKKSDRQKNLEGAFAIEKSCADQIDSNSWICIVDDVISTGSTLLEIEKVLRQNGYHNIIAFGLARGGR